MHAIYSIYFYTYSLSSIQRCHKVKECEKYNLLMFIKSYYRTAENTTISGEKLSTFKLVHH